MVNVIQYIHKIILLPTFDVLCDDDKWSRLTRTRALDADYPGIYLKWPKFVDGIFKCISLSKNHSILIEVSMKFLPMGPVDKKSILAYVMAWCWTDDKPLLQSTLTKMPTPYGVSRA